MQEIFKKIKEKLEKELHLADKEKERCARENQLQFDSAKGYANGIGNAIEIVNQVAEEFGNDTNVWNKDDCCEWVMCDEDENVYNTACGNSEMLFDGSPIDNNYSFCPYCGKKIKLLECTNCKWYWQNNDTENECSGSATTCVEYSEIAPYQPKGD